MSFDSKKGAEMFKILVGKHLLGYMPLDEKEAPFGDADNAIALFFGSTYFPEKNECFIAQSVNQDYCMYDVWELNRIRPPIARDDRYKAIGEDIIAVDIEIQDDESDKSPWYLDKDNFWLFIRTKTKVIRLGHHWNDCHYPNSIWEVI